MIIYIALIGLGREILSFHVLVAGGTVSKQVTKESQARSIGYSVISMLRKKWVVM